MIHSSIEKIKPYVVQIATPFATGTGFFMADEKLIVTNEHVVRNCKKLTIQTYKGTRMIGHVAYQDSLIDLAFIKVDTDIDLPALASEKGSKITIGTEVIAVGHPYGLPFSSTFGIVANANLEVEGVSYLMHDAALNPGNSGGPLIDTYGRVIGINSSIIREGKNIGVALHIDKVLDAMKLYHQASQQIITRCGSCRSLITDTSTAPATCPNCGADIKLISRVKEYEPIGVAKKIENIILKTGIDPIISRRGQLSWEMLKGSANISINYHSKSGFLVVNCAMCELPTSNLIDIYQFLLKTNFNLEGMSFGVNDNIISLTATIYDQHLNEESTYELLNELLNIADHYDDILVEKFGANWL